MKLPSLVCLQRKSYNEVTCQCTCHLLVICFNSFLGETPVLSRLARQGCFQSNVKLNMYLFILDNTVDYNKNVNAKTYETILLCNVQAFVPVGLLKIQASAAVMCKGFPYDIDGALPPGTEHPITYISSIPVCAFVHIALAVNFATA